MPIEFRCPACGKLLRTPDASAGKKGKCPHCQAVTDIPLASTPTPSAGPAAGSPPASGAPATPPKTDLFASPPGSAPNPAPPTGLGVDLFGSPPPGTPTTPSPGTDLFANLPGASPTQTPTTPDLFANLPGSTPAPSSGPDLFANTPGASSSSGGTDLFGGSGAPSGPAPPKDKAQALFSDPFGPGVGSGGYGGGGYGGGDYGGGDPGGGSYSSAPPNPYGAPSYAASQPSYGYHSGLQPHRAGMVLALGIISLITGISGLLGFCCCLFGLVNVATLALGIPAAILGHIDLGKMREGTMDPSGHGATMTGYVMGIISLVLVLLSFVLIFLNIFLHIGMSAMQQQRLN